jgi:hypothetical protein
MGRNAGLGISGYVNLLPLSIKALAPIEVADFKIKGYEV